MWEEILIQKKSEGVPCYWKPGFIPFLRLQYFGCVVIDTVGYFGGVPGQLIDFDYKSGEGYSVLYKSVAHWLLTIICLLKEGILAHKEGM